MVLLAPPVADGVAITRVDIPPPTRVYAPPSGADAEVPPLSPQEPLALGVGPAITTSAAAIEAPEPLARAGVGEAAIRDTP